MAAVPFAECARVVVLRSGVSERNGHELRRIVGLHPHEHAMLAILLGLAHGFADIRHGSDLGPADLKDDVTTLEAMLGRNAVGIDLSHHHAVGPASGNFFGRGQRHAKLGQAGTCGLGVRIGGAGLS